MLASIIVAMGILVGCDRNPPVVDQPETNASSSAKPDTNPEMVSDSKNDSPKSLPPDSDMLDQEFMIMAYNVENLFDIDEQALFTDYQPSQYGPAQLLKKLQSLTRILKKYQDGKGPEIVMFQELENDLTPAPAPIDYEKLLMPFQQMSVEEMLTGEISPTVRDLPAEAFLVKSFQEAGLGPYHVAVAEYRDDPTGRTVAHVNATFSRFPIAEVRTHHSDGARGTLEVVHQIGSHRLHSFNSHWKSGASDKAAEQIRLKNAQVVRNRLNEILSQDPHADVVLAGDYNSHYNQSQRFSSWRKTAINDVLGSQGDELAIRKIDGPDLYNLWYELPPEDRKSDAYRGKWGTLMQIMITRGLYDHRGVQYVDNSKEVAAHSGINAQHGSGMPIRWSSFNGEGGGYSDHFPVFARFRVATQNDSKKFVELNQPSRPTETEAELTGISVDYSDVPQELVLTTEGLGSDAKIQNIDNRGRVILVRAIVSGEKPFVVKVFEDEYAVWSFDLDLRLKIYKRFPVGSEMFFLGELDFHNGKWQFVVHDLSWLDPR